ncbi:MAG: ATP-binding cassette domain-containing protein [Candidatus Sumerlaeia bacterium]|nr:ATP-binding cassette domain-containing protein [Candidatus Sumerlaeia bacterium]
MSDSALVLDGVTKRFGSLLAVDALTLCVPRGCIYGFLGPNGAGKTTTLRMIMDIIAPDSGRIDVLGRTPGAAKDLIGYMPEERGLYRKMTVRAVLAYLGAIKGMKSRDALRAIAIWLERMGLADRAGCKVEELSKGMQQKIQFVATVFSDPQILILDEPFSGLDPLNLDLIKDIMLEMRAAGKTVIFSTHMMEQAERLCDYMLLINKGRMVFDGTFAQVQSEYESNAVLVEIEGEGDFIQSLPMVRAVRVQGKRLEIELVEGADNQDLLRALLQRARVRSFEIKVPTLHEIFVHRVGGGHE